LEQIAREKYMYFSLAICSNEIYNKKNGKRKKPIREGKAFKIGLFLE